MELYSMLSTKTKTPNFGVLLLHTTLNAQRKCGIITFFYTLPQLPTANGLLP
jgi:hypothetical protein